MSIDPEAKPSLLAPLKDEYEIPQENAGRILAKIQASYAQRAEATQTPVSPSAVASGGKGALRMTLLLGASCLALAVASAAVFGRPATPAADRAVAKPAPTTVVPAQPTPASSAEKEGAASVPSVSIDELPTTSDRPANEPKKASLPSATNPKPAASPASKPGADSEASEALERETLLVTGARRALNAGDADKALALLDEHARLFPNGWLANDRAAERIVVLCSLGRQAEATREAAAFLRGRPKSPLTRRVETSCAVQTPKTRQ